MFTTWGRGVILLLIASLMLAYAETIMGYDLDAFFYALCALVLAALIYNVVVVMQNPQFTSPDWVGGGEAQKRADEKKAAEAASAAAVAETPEEVRVREEAMTRAYLYANPLVVLRVLGYGGAAGSAPPATPPPVGVAEWGAPGAVGGSGKTPAGLPQPPQPALRPWEARPGVPVPAPAPPPQMQPPQPPPQPARGVGARPPPAYSHPPPPPPLPQAGPPVVGVRGAASDPRSMFNPFGGTTVPGAVGHAAAGGAPNNLPADSPHNPFNGPKPRAPSIWDGPERKGSAVERANPLRGARVVPPKEEEEPPNPFA